MLTKKILLPEPNHFTRLSKGDGILDELIGTGGTEHARKCRLGQAITPESREHLCGVQTY